MQVHCNEGVAIRIGPKPCGHAREDVAEASAGVRAGQPLSHEIVLVLVADTFHTVEGHTSPCAIASAVGGGVDGAVELERAQRVHRIQAREQPACPASTILSCAQGNCRPPGTGRPRAEVLQEDDLRKSIASARD